MAAMFGADLDALRMLGKSLVEAQDRIEEIATRLSELILTTVVWKGTDADRFRSAWDGELRAALHNAARAVGAASENANRNADEQEQASAADGSGGISSAPMPHAGSEGGIASPLPHVGTDGPNFVTPLPHVGTEGPTFATPLPNVGPNGPTFATPMPYVDSGSPNIATPMPYRLPEGSRPSPGFGVEAVPLPWFRPTPTPDIEIRPAERYSVGTIDGGRLDHSPFGPQTRPTPRPIINDRGHPDHSIEPI